MKVKCLKGTRCCSSIYSTKSAFYRGLISSGPAVYFFYIDLTDRQTLLDTLNSPECSWQTYRSLNMLTSFRFNYLQMTLTAIIGFSFHKIFILCSLSDFKGHHNIQHFVMQKSSSHFTYCAI